MYKYQGFWDRIANTYAKKPIKDQKAFDNMVRNIRKHVKETDTVFEFGCGTGTYSIAIADKVKSVHATDISEKMLAIASERANKRGIGNMNFEHLGIFDAKLQPESYTVVLAFNVLHLQQDVNKVLQRINELLMPGGLLISKTVCAGEKFSLVTFLMKPFSKLGILPYINCFSLAQLQASISQNQLKIVETKDNYEGSMEYFVVAQK
jgi:2-polyprenyl-3-methyl-5-hydroxy-6-metoxy-1,4-benzoquinol methylase